MRGGSYLIVSGEMLDTLTRSRHVASPPQTCSVSSAHSGARITLWLISRLHTPLTLLHRRPNPYVLLSAIASLGLALSACSGGGESRSSDVQAGSPCQPTLEVVRDCLGAMSTVPRPQSAGVAGTSSPIKFYLDRSGSMSGYLDTAFASSFGVGADRESLRQLLSSIAGVSGARIETFGFGQRVVRVQAQSNQDVMGKLVRREFYTDNDTRLEDVLDSLAVDTMRSSAHIIVTDGRRGSGAAALAQYKRLGESARAWTSDGGHSSPGLFLMLALDAPFVQVRDDKAGCLASMSVAPIRCPLYAFVFTPRAGSAELLEALRGVHGRLFMMPGMTDEALAVTAARSGAAGAGDLHVFPAQGAVPLTLLYHTDAAPPQGIARVNVLASLATQGSLARFSRDDSLEVQIASAPLLHNAKPKWTPVTNTANAWAAVTSHSLDTSSGALGLMLELRARPEVPPTAYRLELVSTGRPAWVDKFDAPEFGDLTRTYGLTSLFAYLKPRQTTLATLFAGVY
ncbi:MAG: hypothetical protein JWM95_49 [Gemmatimonadetes bacterium]|nr:hypothetical protein [Gemmatimonadota bacterium]